ncbi:MAG: HPr kinase/phosphatase C-terminal domain-containing protein [Pseudomonadota bacterium]
MSTTSAARADQARSATINIHATCVAIGEMGVLLRGPSGTGKSDLALRLIEGGADLVADDRVDIRRDGGRVMASAPSALAGLIEATGLGPLEVANRAEVAIGLIVDLVPRCELERMPEPAQESLLEIDLPCVTLDPFGAATPAKLKLLAGGARMVSEARSHDPG